MVRVSVMVIMFFLCTVKTQPMKYGDRISFSRGLYTHWAVYTGKNDKGQDMAVEFTGECGLNSKEGATVKEGLLKDGGKVDNQFDAKFPPQSEEKMRATVQEILKNGVGNYRVLDNNCEHIATYIRNGVHKSKQADRVLESQANFNNEIAGNMGASFN